MEVVEYEVGHRVRIEIDLNVRTPDGLTRSRVSRANGPIAVGDPVTVFEPDDGVAGNAVVAFVDEPGDFVYLDVDWQSLRDDSMGVLRDSVTIAGDFGSNKSRHNNHANRRPVRLRAVISVERVDRPTPAGVGHGSGGFVSPANSWSMSGTTSTRHHSRHRFIHRVAEVG